MGKKNQLKRSLQQNYDLAASTLTKKRGVYRVECADNVYALKKITAPREAFMFVFAALEYATAQGFTRLNRVIRCQNELPYFELHGEIYYLTRWLSGVEADFGKKQDVRQTARALAEFHAATLGFAPRQLCAERDNRGKLPALWQVKINQLYYFRQMAGRETQQTDFDRLYLDLSVAALEDAQQALSDLQKVYPELNALEQHSYCHHNVVAHNVLLHEGAAFLIDFDYGIMDSCCHDLGRFLHRVLRANDFNPKRAEQALRAYCHRHPLQECQRRALMAFLRFPYEYWQVGNHYYNSGEQGQKISKKLSRKLSRKLVRQLETAPARRQALARFEEVLAKALD